MANNLIINNRIITAPIYDILLEVRRELLNGKLSDIIDKGENVVVSCPNHKGGLEQHASCNVYADIEGDRAQYGMAHCFTCGYNATLPEFIGDCFNQDKEFGEQWLLDHYGDTIYQTEEELLPITDTPTKEIAQSHHINIAVDESELDKYNLYHPYMWERKLTKEVVDKFRIGYDESRKAITFPVYDENHRLVMITARCTWNKRFYIPDGVDKPVYLLYDIIERGINTVFICESQINTLTMRTWGYDSVGLFGTGSTYQYDILKKAGINNFILCFDGDEAGRKGEARFRKAFPTSMIIAVHLPQGKDINDITKEEFDALYEKAKNDW